MLVRPSQTNLDGIIPSTHEKNVRVVSYNVAAAFFEKHGMDKNEQWKHRKTYVFEILNKLYPDVIMFQEMSPEQALDIAEHFVMYDAVFLCQHPSDVPAGDIARGTDVKEWTGKFVGTTLIGILTRKFVFEQSTVEPYWFSETPREVPMNLDRGFGNKKTARAILNLMCFHKKTGKPMRFFVSHYPLDGGNETRKKCAELESKYVRSFGDEVLCVSGGDRYLVPDHGDPVAVYDAMVDGLVDIRDSNKHIGPHQTWYGFRNDGFNNRDLSKVHDPRTKGSVMDVMFSNRSSVRSFHHPAGFNPKTSELIGIREFVEQDPRKSYAASDHLLVGADFEI